MIKRYTLENLNDFIKNEEDVISASTNQKFTIETTDSKGPSDFTINNILGFSKALRIEKSSNLDDIEMILN